MEADSSAELLAHQGNYQGAAKVWDIVPFADSILTENHTYNRFTTTPQKKHNKESKSALETGQYSRLELEHLFGLLKDCCL